MSRYVRLFIYSLMLLLLILIFFNRWDEARETILLNEERAILLEARNKDNHYMKYTDGSYIYIVNMKTEEESKWSLLVSDIREALAQEHYEPIPLYPREDSNAYLPSPMSMGLEVSESLPYTYNATLESSFIYLATVLHRGWEIIGQFNTPDYIDYYVTKNQQYGRIIILKDSLKVFNDIKGDKIPDPYTFITK